MSKSSMCAKSEKKQTLCWKMSNSLSGNKGRMCSEANAETAAPVAGGPALLRADCAFDELCGSGKANEVAATKAEDSAESTEVEK